MGVDRVDDFQHFSIKSNPQAYSAMSVGFSEMTQCTALQKKLRSEQIEEGHQILIFCFAYGIISLTSEKE